MSEAGVSEAGLRAGLVVLGDALLDVDLLGEVTRQCPDAPAAPVLDVLVARRRAGGAGLAAVLAAAGGVPVRLVTALAADADAEVLRGLLTPQVEVVAGPASGTTVVKTRLRAGGATLFRVDRGDATAEPAGSALADALDGAGAVLVSDYGRGLTGDPVLRQRLTKLATEVPVVWDPHPRGSTPVPGCTLITPNLDEALLAARCAAAPEACAAAPEAAVSRGRTVSARVRAADRVARRLRARWRADHVVVTLGALGALLRGRGSSRLVRAPRTVLGDPCGAGDRFAASATLALRTGHHPLAAVRSAVCDAARFVGAQNTDPGKTAEGTRRQA